MVIANLDDLLDDIPEDIDMDVFMALVSLQEISIQRFYNGLNLSIENVGLGDIESLNGIISGHESNYFTFKGHGLKMMDFVSLDMYLKNNLSNQDDYRVVNFTVLKYEDNSYMLVMINYKEGTYKPENSVMFRPNDPAVRLCRCIYPLFKELEIRLKSM